MSQATNTTTTLSAETACGIASTLAHLAHQGAELAQVPAGSWLVLWGGSPLRERESDGAIGLGGSGPVAVFTEERAAADCAARMARAARVKGTDTSTLRHVNTETALRQHTQLVATVAGSVLRKLGEDE